jgi:hypothetical protein
MGFQVLPASSERKAPAAEMAMTMRSGLVESRRMVWRQRPPAPRLPVRAGFGGAEAGEFVPGGAGVGGLEEAGVFCSC